MENKNEVDENMKEISRDALAKLKNILMDIALFGSFTENQEREIVSLSKWIKED
jgi:hypothetical protein